MDQTYSTAAKCESSVKYIPLMQTWKPDCLYGVFRWYRQVYIPIEEIDGHWFLMVVAMNELAIYHVDSFPDANVIEERQGRIRALVSAHALPSM